MVIFFLFFLVSGLSSLIYQVVWLRIAMANLGVTTPFVSIVLSVFMAGLALGSWAGGKFTQRFAERSASYFVHSVAEAQFRTVVEREVPLEALIQSDPQSVMLTDDHPVNEYFLVRRLFRNPDAMEPITQR